MATNTSGNSGRALSFRYLTVSPSLFVAKDQSRLVIESFGVNQFVGRRDEEEEEEEEEKKIDRPISVYNCSGVF